MRAEGGVGGVIPLWNRGNGVETVITDRVEREDLDELVLCPIPPIHHQITQSHLVIEW